MRIHILIFFILPLTLAFGQVEWEQFENRIYYGVEDGLPTYRVTSVYEDFQGFIWLATEDGVSRFDGSEFVNFQHFFENGKMHRIGRVETLAFSKEGKTIYLATPTGVLTAQIDQPQFKPLHTLTGSFSNPVEIRTVYVDYQDRLWVATRLHGLMEYKPIAETINSIRLDQWETKNKAPLIVDQITSDPENNNVLWLGSSKGVVKLHSEDRLLDYYPLPNELPRIDACGRLAIKGDKIYMGTFGNGFYVFNKNHLTFQRPLSPTDKGFVDYPLNFYFDNEGGLWITGPRSLIQLDLDNFNVIKEQTATNANSAIGIRLVDSQNRIWLANGLGLHRFDPDNYQKFYHITANSDEESPNIINSIKKIGRELYICPVYGTGIIRFNLDKKEAEHIPIPQFRSIIEDWYRFRDMETTPDGDLVILGDYRIAILDTRRGSSSNPPVQLPDSTKIYRGSIERDAKGNYWIGTHQKGLIKINFEDKSLRVYKEEFQGKNFRNHEYIKKVFADSKNRLWIGQDATSVLDLNNNNLICLNPELSFDHFRQFGEFYEDSQNRIWIANLKDGISYVDENGEGLRLRKVVDGSFIGIYKYNDSLAWTLGTGGLGVLNTKKLTHSVLKLDLPWNLTGPIVDLGKGEFAIGCLNGLVIYNPTLHKNNYKAPRPYVQEIRVNGKSYFQGADLDRLSFVLPSGTRLVNLKLGTLGYSDDGSTNYHYKWEDNWVELPSNKQINLTNLKQGDYNISLLPVSQLHKNHDPIELSFSIEPFWYTTNVAYLIYGLIIILSIYYLYRYDLKKKLAVSEVKRVREISELKSRMFANISHEFRTPLTIIKGISENLRKSETNQTNLDLIQGIEQSNEQLLHLVNQMLDLASLDAKKMVVHYKSGNVVDFIRKCVDLYRSYTDSKLQGLEFISEVEELMMDFDDDKLQKILNNLLSNAIKFTPPDGRISVRLKRKNNTLDIIVSDSGLGISDHDLPNVFDRYYTSNDTQGTGIGLSLTKELVNLLEGEISVYSKLDKGTVFTVSLPIRNQAKDESISHHLPFVDVESVLPLNVNSIMPRHKNTILVVEDNNEIRNYIQSFLSAQYNILTARNGMEGLDYAQSQEIDTVISDIMMPEMDGLDFCRKLKANVATSHIPIIILSARAESKDRQEAYALGVDAYLTKPFSQNELKLILKNLLKKQQRQQEELSKLMHLQQPDDVQEINKLDLDLIKKLQTIILNSSSKLKAAEIAKKLFISRTQLHRKVKSLTGKSLTQYANHLKIEKAKHLLKTSDLQIQEIACEVGFESSAYFNRMFKKHTKTTPESFRNPS